MEKIVYPSLEISGKIKIPASKSYCQRAFAAALMVNGDTYIKDYGNSDDENAALEIVKQAGASVKSISKTEICITSSGTIQKDLKINYGESGLSARMFTPLLAIGNNLVKMEAKGSLLSRPMYFFDSILKDLKVNFNSSNGYLPFELKGPLIPKNCTIDGSMSSQFITGLIYAYAASPETKKVQIKIENPTSIPYINLTLDVLKKFGVDILFEDNILYFEGPYVFNSANIIVEGDWSSASFLLVAGAISGSITIENLNLSSMQADKKIIEAIKDFGAIIEIDKTSISIKRKENNSFNFDATHCPDLFPPLAVLAMYAKGVSTIKGVKRLINKESNRSIAIQDELGKMGALIVVEDDEMFIKGIEKSKSTNVHSHGDHRIAMACAIAALKADGPVNISDYKAVNKSYPMFFEHLNKIQNN
jgi:3-phosphoshikimate 1-carboxyvinyltransferase